MTNKQIIIDGCDVSGCEDYKCDGTCANSAYHLFNFETKYANCQNRNCYYKQLKRKEQECKALRDEKAYTDLGYDQLKADKEKIEQCLIEQNRLVVGMTKEISNLTHKKCELEHKLNLIKEENIIFTLDSKKLIAQYSAKLKQLKQTLTEIKEIAGHPKGCCVICDRLDKILQKIREMEDE